MRSGEFMINLDKLGDRFNAFKKLGEETRILIGKRNGNKTDEWSLYEHRDVDGVGVLVSELEKSVKVTHVPEMKNPIRPLWPKLLYLFFKYMKWASGDKPTWNKNYNWDVVGPPKTSSLYFFSKDVTAKIHQYCKENKVSVTSFFLDAIDHSLSGELLNIDKRKWVVPINIRGFVGEKVEKRNLSVVCQIWISGNEYNERRIQDKLKSFLKQGLHWGGFVSLLIQSKLSEKTLIKILKKHKNIAHGLFTNIGSWPNNYIEGDFRDHLVVAIPSSRLMPISCLMLEFHEQIQLNLSFHPCLGISELEQQKLMENWINVSYQKLNLDIEDVLIENIALRDILSGNGSLQTN